MWHASYRIKHKYELNSMQNMTNILGILLMMNEVCWNWLVFMCICMSCFQLRTVKSNKNGMNDCTSHAHHHSSPFLWCTFQLITFIFEWNCGNTWIIKRPFHVKRFYRILCIPNDLCVCHEHKVEWSPIRGFIFFCWWFLVFSFSLWVDDMNLWRSSHFFP